MEIRGNLTADRYSELVFRPLVLPYVRDNDDVIFMHDNARPHIAHQCLKLLSSENVTLLDLSPYSPDMNPIGHAWDLLDRRVRQREIPPTNPHQSREAPKE